MGVYLLVAKLYEIIFLILIIKSFVWIIEVCMESYFPEELVSMALVIISSQCNNVGTYFMPPDNTDFFFTQMTRSSGIVTTCFSEVTKFILEFRCSNLDDFTSFIILCSLAFTLCISLAAVTKTTWVNSFWHESLADVMLRPEVYMHLERLFSSVFWHMKRSLDQLCYEDYVKNCWQLVVIYQSILCPLPILVFSSDTLINIVYHFPCLI